MFTVPIGFFGSSTNVIRPNSVVDTPGSGTITNSSSAYDANPSSYADFLSHTAYPNTPTTYSIYSFAAGPSTRAGQTFNINGFSVGGNNDNGSTVSISYDSGATYTTLTTLSTIGGLPGAFGPYGFPVVPSIPLANIKVKIAMSYFFSDPTEVYIYDMYIQ